MIALNILKYLKSIELKIYFKYPSSRSNNLKNINLKIKNSFIALLENQSWKSTIIDIILGLLEPIRKILIDGEFTFRKNIK